VATEASSPTLVSCGEAAGPRIAQAGAKVWNREVMGALEPRTRAPQRGGTLGDSGGPADPAGSWIRSRAPEGQIAGVERRDVDGWERRFRPKPNEHAGAGDRGSEHRHELNTSGKAVFGAACFGATARGARRRNRRSRGGLARDHPPEGGEDCARSMG
jgi:hypothetical protein